MSQLLGTVGIYTLGCKVNQYESEAIAEGLASRGFSVVPFSEVCDAYIINTCTVTAESDRKARQLIRRAIKNNPTAYILVTGCMAEVFSDKLSKIEGIDYICGNGHKMQVIEALENLFAQGHKTLAHKLQSLRLMNLKRCKSHILTAHAPTSKLRTVVRTVAPIASFPKHAERCVPKHPRMSLRKCEHSPSAVVAR